MSFKNVFFVILAFGFLYPVSALSNTGYQGFNVGVNLFYRTSEVELTSGGAPVTTESSRMTPEIQAGYTMPMGLYLGVISFSESRDDGTNSLATTMTGASVGYMHEGFKIVGHYFLSGEYELSTTNTAEGGSGIGVDIGYQISFGVFSIGPQLSHRSFSYDEDSAGTDPFELTITSMEPTLHFGLTF